MIGWMRDYVEASRGPWGSLCFVAPALAGYEATRWVYGAPGLACTAEAWLRATWQSLGLGPAWLVPLVPLVVLAVWHLVSRRRSAWRWRFGPLMLVECLVLALAGWALAHWLAAHLGWPNHLAALALLESPPPEQGARLARLLGWLGHGLYEEVLCRLLLLPLLTMVFRRLGLHLAVSALSALLITSLLLPLAQLSWTSLSAGDWSALVLQAWAGAVLALLFWCRGFGVAAGTHALFNLLVAVAWLA